MSMMDDQKGGGINFQNLETQQRLMIVAINGLQQTLKIGFASTLPVSSPLAVNNLGTSSIQVIGADSTRVALLFHNPNDSVSVIVCPATDANGATLTPSFTTRGGGFIILPQDYLPVSGNCQTAWKAIAASGAANGLTISSV